MKVILEMEIDEKAMKEEFEYRKLTEEFPSQKQIKEELTQMLFEVCEDWVLRGQQPDLEFE